MPARWMWGWELGVDLLTYQNTGWGTGANTSTINVQSTVTFQPAVGYGGGRFALSVGGQTLGNAGRLKTPTTGPNSTGTHTAFIFHDAYKRSGNTAVISQEGGALLRFYSGVTEVIRLSQASSNVAISALELFVNGNSQGTTTTTYTSTQPYHRIVLDMNGTTGDYDVYVNGVLEISVPGSVDKFASIDGLEFLPGSVAYAPSGGFHDHAVLFDSPADLALALGDIFIQGLRPNLDSVDGNWWNVGGPNDGTQTDLYGNINDGSNLTDFIETTTLADVNEFQHENRADINPGWAPSSVHYVQSIQVARGSGAISAGRLTIENPTMGKVTSANKALVASGKMLNELVTWTGNATTDLDGLKTGFEV